LGLGDAGKSYADPTPISIGWDQVIHDLTHNTAIKASKYVAHSSGTSGSAAKSIHRGQGYDFTAGALHSMSSLTGSGLTTLASFGGPPSIEGGWPDEGDGGGAISTIEFVFNTDRKD